MKPSEYIRKGWTQGNGAKDCYGCSCEPTSKYAVSWCAVGAIMAACKEDSENISMLIKRVRDSLNVPRLTLWNDEPGRTKQEVIDALEKVGL